MATQIRARAAALKALGDAGIKRRAARSEAAGF
jgi:hypothetical protein